MNRWEAEYVLEGTLDYAYRLEAVEEPALANKVRAIGRKLADRVESEGLIDDGNVVWFEGVRQNLGRNRNP